MDLISPRDSLLLQVEHFIKNRMQAMFGGGFLVESGLRSNDLPTVSKGWRFVNANQFELVRSLSHLLALGRSGEEVRETATLDELVRATQNDFEGLQDHFQFGLCFDVNSETENPPLVLVERKSILSALFGIFRIGEICAGSRSNARVIVEISQEQGESILRCTFDKLEFMLDFTDQSSDRNPLMDRRLCESATLEWKVAQYTLRSHQGSLEHQPVTERQFIIEAKLPNVGLTQLVSN